MFYIRNKKNPQTENYVLDISKTCDEYLKQSQLTTNSDKNKDQFIFHFQTKLWSGQKRKLKKNTLPWHGEMINVYYTASISS